ncbi:MAG: 16S rRNA (cytidine(1402)-2'-O)-methyltransferase [Chloroflexi bacterium RBG_16_68_14]|nr:MAG: 16S rRNA (cytidine(1402)-2'-O)-methyltransferase [Chloroflexi bacterium RBG_16_68_14]
MGILYLVATPIGNLEDITLRALRVLGEVPLIAAEDTRTIRKLLTHYRIRRPRLLSYTERNRRIRTPAILAALQEGDVALVSEAGMPGISDPGVHLVEAAAAAGCRVVPVPGPSALTAALAASGLPTRRFHYLVFLPRTAGRRRRLLQEVATLPETLVAFEAPHRLRRTLGDLREALGDRRIAVCRELTKLHEEIFRGTLSTALDHFTEPRGECTLVIEGAGDSKPKREAPVDIDGHLRELKAQSLRARDAVREVARRSGMSRQEVYRRWLALSKE